MKYIIILFCFLLFSCKENNKKAISSVLEYWDHREVLFPASSVFTIQGKDTIDHFINSKYKIISYIDSTGCTSCKLRLDEWKIFISHIDSLFQPRVVQFLFFFTPKNKNEIYRILAYNKFTYPICIDELDSINKINKLPSEINLQTFLLNQENRVIAVGNPIYNPQIKELYLNIISDREDTKKEKLSQTIVNFTEVNINMGKFNWKEKQEKDIIMSNVGNLPLIISNIVTSCGCTTVEYSKEPIQSGKSLILKVKYKAEHPEHFNKTITVYCNTKDSPFQLKISGNAK